MTMVTDGRLKASLRAVKTPPYDFLGLPWTRSLEEDHQPLQPGVPVELKFDLLPLSHVFRAGHHWRLTVTGSDPRDRRPVQQGAQLTVHADVQHPSALQLPFATAPPGGPRVSP
jgi:predicted acyl esterase